MEWFLGGILAPITAGVALDIWRRQHAARPEAAERAVGKMLQGVLWMIAAVVWLFAVPTFGYTNSFFHILMNWALFLFFIWLVVTAILCWRDAYRALRTPPEPAGATADDA